MTHQGSTPYADSSTSARAGQRLVGDRVGDLAERVTSSHRRAIQPSTRSVAEANAKVRQAAIRQPGEVISDTITKADEDRDQQQPQRR